MLSGPNAHAVPVHPIDLEYDAPPECPAKPFVVQQISTLVRHPPSTAVQAIATIKRGPGEYRLTLHVEGGSQRIVSRSCDSLVQSLTVILALIIDPKSSELEPPARNQESPNAKTPVSGPPPNTAPPNTAPSNTAPSPSVQSPPNIAKLPAVERKDAGARPAKPTTRNVPPRNTPKVVPTAERPKDSGKARTVTLSQSVDTEPSDSKLTLHPELLLLTEYGMLPHLAAGPSVGLWADRGRASLAVSAVWLAPEWAQMPGTSKPQGGYISFLGGKVDLCMAHLRTKVLRSCAGVESGDLMGKGSGLTQTQLGHGIWLAGTLESGFRLKVSRLLAVDLRLGLAIPVKRPAFGFDGYSWRFEPHGWSLRLATGFLWR